MSRYTKIPENTFEQLQMDAGVLLRSFNPASPAEPADEDLITATTGGINAVCQPTYSDMGEDVDNCPNNMKEMKHVDGWDCRLSTTALGTSAELIRLSLGAADINAETGKISPRKDLAQTDFADIWWVGDKAGGGLVAVRLINALSTGGFNLQTTKNGKGQNSIELTGHVSISQQDTMPMEFYSIDDVPDVATIKNMLTHVTNSNDAQSVTIGDAYEATLTADEDYTLGSVIVTMDGEDVTSTAYTAGAVNIASVTGDVVIMATATA